MKSTLRTLKSKLGILFPVLHRPVEAGLGCILAPDCEFGCSVRIQRWTSLYGCNLSSHVTIGPRSYFAHVAVGSYSALGNGIWMERVKLGRFCSVGPRCFAGFGEHPTNMLSTSPVFYSTRKQCGVSFADHDHFEEMKDIEIGNDVWIGADVFIRSGIRIGNGAIIAAGAKVMSDVEDYAIVGGVPAKVIRYRFEERERGLLLALRWWDWREQDLKAASALFRNGNVEELVAWARQRGLSEEDQSSA